MSQLFSDLFRDIQNIKAQKRLINHREALRHEYELERIKKLEQLDAKQVKRRVFLENLISRSLALSNYHDVYPLARSLDASIRSRTETIKKASVATTFATKHSDQLKPYRFLLRYSHLREFQLDTFLALYLCIDSQDPALHEQYGANFINSNTLSLWSKWILGVTSVFAAIGERFLHSNALTASGFNSPDISEVLYQNHATNDELTIAEQAISDNATQRMFITGCKELYGYLAQESTDAFTLELTHNEEAQKLLSTLTKSGMWNFFPTVFDSLFDDKRNDVMSGVMNHNTFSMISHLFTNPLSENQAETVELQSLMRLRDFMPIHYVVPLTLVLMRMCNNEAYQEFLKRLLSYQREQSSPNPNGEVRSMTMPLDWMNSFVDLDLYFGTDGKSYRENEGLSARLSGISQLFTNADDIRQSGQDFDLRNRVSLLNGFAAVLGGVTEKEIEQNGFRPNPQTGTKVALNDTDVPTLQQELQSALTTSPVFTGELAEHFKRLKTQAVAPQILEEVESEVVVPQDNKEEKTQAIWDQIQREIRGEAE